MTFPWITISFGAYGAGINRILLGILHGPCTSVISGSWYFWSLRSELTKLSAIYQLGTGIGMISAGVIAGAMLAWAYHWQHVFYFMAFLYFIDAVF